MYLEMATEEDKKMVENWKADADGILIFVSLSSNLVLHTNSIVIDWFILCCCRVVDLSVDSGHSTEPTGNLQLLSAAVASLILVSIQDIRPNPQETSNFYLANIYQTVADPNRHNISSSSLLPHPHSLHQTMPFG